MKGKWHRIWYGSRCHSSYLERARSRNQKASQQEDIHSVRLVRTLLQDGKVINMADLKPVYFDSFRSIGVNGIQPTTHVMKETISSHIDDVHFMIAKRRNKSGRINSSDVQDSAIEDAMVKKTDSSIRQLFDSACVYSEVPSLIIPNTRGHFRESSTRMMLCHYTS